MAHRSPEEVTSHHIEKMGEALGRQFDALWHDVAWLHRKWAEYVELFGSKETRVELLNQAAPQFFRMIQDALWEETLLHVARLTDKSTSPGRRQNLTVQNLPQLTKDQKTKERVSILVEKAVIEATFCRDWRNRRIAHRDLDLATNQSAKPLEGASRKQVSQVLKAIAEVLHAVEDHYIQSETFFEGMHPAGGAVSLLHVLDAGVRAQAEHRERRRRGGTSGNNYRPDI
jgi:AbiU2